jgi:HAD superfamily hydrolase (TIGR01450 family)
MWYGSEMSTFIFDLDGTLYRGDEALPGARETVAALQARGRRVTYCTNNGTRTRADFQRKLEGLGFAVAPGSLVASAYATGLYLRELPTPPRSLLILGAPSVATEVAAAGLDARTDGAPPIDAVVVSLDQAFTYDRLAAAQAALLAGAMLVATNRDLQLPGHGRVYPGAGSIVAAVEAASARKATAIGKPEPYMYEALMRAGGAAWETTVVVGDNMLTDIAAAAPLGLYSVLVLTGVSVAPPSDAELRPDLVISSMADLIPALERARPDLSS